MMNYSKYVCRNTLWSMRYTLVNISANATWCYILHVNTLCLHILCTQNTMHIYTYIITRQGVHFFYKKLHRMRAKDAPILSHQARSSLETDSGYKNQNIGFYPKSLRPFLPILCVVDDSIYACRKNFSSLPATSLAINCSD